MSTLSASAISLQSQASSVTVFSGLHFSEWSEQVNFYLGVLDLDLALLQDKPVDITDDSTKDERFELKEWERSNRLSLMFMRMTIANNIKTTIPQTESTKEYLKFVEERFQSADKSFAGTLMAQLMTMKFDGSRSMQEHTIEMTNIAARLQTLGVMKTLKPKVTKNFKKKGHTSVSQDRKKDIKTDRCHFCKKEGHYQKDCLKRKA
ncbi:hypothetical protein Dimus_038117 [Dionaea muscipula]